MAKTLHYDFKSSPSLAAVTGPTLDITRTTKARMKDADGWLREVQDGEARFPGAAFSNNLVAPSNDLGDTNYSKTRLTIGTGKEDPFGGTDGESLDEDGSAANSHFINANFSQNVTPTVAEGGTALASLYVKASNRSWIKLGIFINSGAQAQVFFDVTNGVTGTTVGAPTDYGIEDVGNGWYRCWLARSNMGTGTAGKVQISIAEDDNDITFDGLSQESLLVYGLQVEDVSGAWDSQNLLLQSNSFDTTWSNTNSTESSGETDPDGGSTAWAMQDDATDGQHYLQQAVTHPEPGYYRISVYLKAGSRDWVEFGWTNLKNGSASNFTLQYFDITNGVTGTAVGNVYNASISDVGNGWYRCSFEYDVTSNDLSGNLRIFACEGDNDNSYAGDGSDAFLLWHSQIERGKPNDTAPGTYTATTTAAVTNYSPSTYIPTTTAAVSSLSGTNDGLLVEEARTNIALQSEDFSTTWVAAGNPTVNTNQTIAPDGSLTADRLIDDSSTGAGTAGVFQNVTVSSGDAHVYSVFVKADQLSWVRLNTNNFDAGANNNTWFNLSTGVVGTQNHDDAGIEDYGNGWYRCWVQFTTTTDTSGRIYVYVADADNNNIVDLDGTSSIFVWGAQLEAGAFPTSYIPTTTANVTRNADAIVSTDMSWYDAGDGATMYTHAEVIDTVGGGNHKLWEISDNSTSDRLYQFVANTGRITAQIQTTVGTDQIVTGTQVQDDGTAFRTAWAYAENDIQGYTDGALDGLQTNNTYPTSQALTKLQVGVGQNSFYVNGLIKEIRYYDERLTNEQLLDMSNGIFPSTFAGVRDIVQDIARDLVRPIAS